VPIHIVKQMQDPIIAHGTLDVYVRRKGKLVNQWRQHNRTVLSGMGLIRDLMACKPDVTGLSHYAVGTGTTAASSADTALEIEEFRDTITKFERDAGVLRVYFYLPTSAANGKTITEVGELGDGGTVLYARALLSQPIDKTADVSVTFVHTNLWEAVG
jgi:hypothetical protein